LALALSSCFISRTIEQHAYADFAGPLHHQQVGDVDYGYHRFGSGPPLVLVCGITMTMSQWDLRLLKDLRHSFDVVIFDNPGIGESADSSKAPLSIEGMAAGTIAFAEALGLERPNILGWSMGGEIATAIGALHADKVGAVVVAAGNPGGSHAVPTKGKAFETLVNSKATGMARKREIASVLFPKDQRSAAMHYGFDLMLVPQETATKEAVARQVAAVRQWKAGPGVWEQLGRTPSRMLFAGGDDDVIVPIQNSGNMAAQAPKGQLERYPDAGHAFLFQEPGAFAAKVKQFVLGS